MNDKVYKKLSEDFIKRGIIQLDDCEVIEYEQKIYIIKQENKEWFFNVGLENLYVGFNYWYFRPSIKLYGFNQTQGNEVLLTILKTKLHNYAGETGEIIKSLVEWDVQPSFIGYELLDKILKKNSDD